MTDELSIADRIRQAVASEAETLVFRTDAELGRTMNMTRPHFRKQRLIAGVPSYWQRIRQHRSEPLYRQVMHIISSENKFQPFMDSALSKMTGATLGRVQAVRNDYAIVGYIRRRRNYAKGANGK